MSILTEYDDTWTETDEMNANEAALYMGPPDSDNNDNNGNGNGDDCNDQDSESGW